MQATAKDALITDMSTRELIDGIVAELPESLQQEVYNFARFLKMKTDDGDWFNGLLMSDSVLYRIWNTPEEDLAWKNL